VLLLERAQVRLQPPPLLGQSGACLRLGIAREQREQALAPGAGVRPILWCPSLPVTARLLLVRGRLKWVVRCTWPEMSCVAQPPSPSPSTLITVRWKRLRWWRCETEIIVIPRSWHAQSKSDSMSTETAADASSSTAKSGGPVHVRRVISTVVHSVSYTYKLLATDYPGNQEACPFELVWMRSIAESTRCHPPHSPF
jgi:hypothetical protein